MGQGLYSFGGYCTDEDYAIQRPIDVHVLNPGKKICHQPLLRLYNHQHFICTISFVVQRQNSVPMKATFLICPYMQYFRRFIVN